MNTLIDRVLRGAGVGFFDFPNLVTLQKLKFSDFPQGIS